jgi:hypothetical protein
MVALVAAVAFVGALGGMNLLLSLALARRLRLMHLGPADPHSGKTSPGVEVGSFKAMTLDGDFVTDEEFSAGSSLVAFLAVGCRACPPVKQEVLNSHLQEQLTIFIHGEAPGGGVPDFATDLSRRGRVILTRWDDAPRKAFEVDGFPTVLRIVDGVVAASGFTLGEIVSASTAI